MTTTQTTKHELVNEDTVFAGSAVEIVQLMREQAYFERGVPLEDYLEQLACFIRSCSGADITLSGEDFETRAESFIQELLRVGYFKEA